MTPDAPTRRDFLGRLLGVTASAPVLPAVAVSAASPSSLTVIESVAGPPVPLVAGDSFLAYAALRRAAFRHMDRLGLSYREGMRLAIAASADPPPPAISSWRWPGFPPGDGPDGAHRRGGRRLGDRGRPADPVPREARPRPPRLDRVPLSAAGARGEGSGGARRIADLVGRFASKGNGVKGLPARTA